MESHSCMEKGLLLETRKNSYVVTVVDKGLYLPG